MAPIISVIVPCYNQEKYLRDALDSVLHQTLDDWECVIVNDGSTDGSLRIAKEYAQKDSRFLIVDIPNGGLANARNTGIKASHGKYISTLDSDDKFDVSYLEKAVDCLENNLNTKLVYCYAEYFGDVVAEFELPDFNYDRFLWNNLLYVPSVYRRSDYDQTSGYNPNMKHGHEDWDFWLSLIKRGDIVYRIPEVLFYYRKHGVSMLNGTMHHLYETNTQMIKNHWDLYEPYLADMFEYRKTKFDYELSLKWNEHLEKELNGILNSKAYKLGKVLLSPFHLVKQLLKR